MATHSWSAPLLLLLLIFLSGPMVSTWLDPFLTMVDPSPGVAVSGPVLFAQAQKNTFSLFSRSKPEVKLDDQESIKKEREVLEALSGISSPKKHDKDGESKKAKADSKVYQNEKQDKEVGSGKGNGGSKDKAEDKSKKKLLPKRKGVDDLLQAIVADSPPSQSPSQTAEHDSKDNGDKGDTITVNTDNKIDEKIQGEKKEKSSSTKETIKTTTKTKKKKTEDEDDIIHEHDHADNDAYDDIVWYDGPHSDDEDEHGDHHDDDHDDDDHDDDDHGDDHDDDHHDEDHDEDKDVPAKSSDKQALPHVVVQDQQQVLSNLQKVSGTKPKSKSKSNAIKADDATPPSEHNHDNAHDSSPGTFHHSGADALQGSISPTEFCLRLKHECESTCRKFKAGVLHISTTCETGSVAELLFWGKCCQIGQEHRVNTPSSDAKKSKKKAQGQSGQPKQQEKQGQKVLQGQPPQEQKEQKQGEQESDLSQQYLKRQQKRHEAQRASKADQQKSTS